MDADLTLVDVLTNKFSLDDLTRLCFNLGIVAEKEISRRDTTQAFAVALIQHCERQGRIAELEAAVKAMRPDLSWRPYEPRREPASPSLRLPPPELPKYVLPRPEEVARLRALLLAPGAATVGIVGARRSDEKIVGVRGMGGIGKTVLATVLAHDETLRAHFTDGIFWLTLGEGVSEASRLTHQTSLARALGDSAPFTDLRAGKMRLRELLAERRCLLVLDDVWQSKDTEPFKVLGPEGRLLLTTRDAQVLNQLDARTYDLNLLGEAQALGLLGWWAKQEPGSLPPEATAIAKECGYLPLALAMVGALIGDEVDTWASALQKLWARDLKAVAREVGEDYAYPSLWRAIEVSVEALPTDLRDRYADFALFPADTPIPPAVLHTLWEHEGMPTHRVTNALNILANRSLLRKDDAVHYTLHDLQLDFVREQTSALLAQHQRLLNAYAAQCDDGWASGPDDGYFFQQLPYHLLEAGRGTELETLLLDYQWLRARLQATDIFALLGDFERLSLPRYHRTDFPNPGSPDHALSALQDSLQKSAHVLAHDKNQLSAHLLGRLLAEPPPSLMPLLDQVRQADILTPWLCPLRASLEPPGGPLLRTLVGHTGRVLGVALSEDRGLIVSASEDWTLKVWEVATGRELRTLIGHTDSVLSVAVSGDGKLAVSTSADHTLKVWEVATGRELRTLTGHTGVVRSVAMSRDGSLAISASHDNTLKIWEVATGRTLHTLAGHTRGVRGVAVRSDGRLAVSASDDGTLKVWDVATGETLDTLTGHTDWVRSVAMSEDGRLAISVSADGRLVVWDLTIGRARRTIAGYAQRVNRVAVSGDGRLAVSASDDGSLKMLEVMADRHWHTSAKHMGRVNSVVVSRDGRLAVSASDDGTLKIWEVVTRSILHMLGGHTGAVWGVAVSGDGRLTVSASDDTKLKVWGMTPSRLQHTLAGHTDWVLGVAVNRDGQIAISASADGTLKVWDLLKGQMLCTLAGHSWWVNSVALSGNGRVAVSASDDRTLKVWEIPTGRELHTLAGHTGGVLGVAVSEDGRLALSASLDGTLKVWEVRTGRELRALGGRTGGLRCVGLSRDGHLAVSTSSDGKLKVWEVGTGRELRTLAGHLGKVQGVALNADGRLAVSASSDRMLKVWEVDTGRCLATFETDEPLYCCGMALPFIVAGGASGRVHFLRLMNGRGGEGERGRHGIGH